MTTNLCVTFDGEASFEADRLATDPATDALMTWNGFDAPLFTTEQGKAVMAYMAVLAEQFPDSLDLNYDETRDVFVVVDSADPDAIERYDVTVHEVDGVRLHAIGAFSWTWSVVEAEVA